MSGRSWSEQERGLHADRSPGSSRGTGPRGNIVGVMATVLATNQRVESDKSTVFYAVTALLVAYVLVSIWLLAAGARDYPILPTILDTGVGLIAAVLGALLWVMGRHVGVPFLIWLAIAFGGAAFLHLIHILVAVEWPGGSVSAPSAETMGAATWEPGAYLLPVAIGGSLWMLAANKRNILGFAIAVLVAAVALFAIFQWLPPEARQTHFGITRPALFLAPLLWLGIAIHCWRGRAGDRMLRALAWTAPVLVVANLVMLYAQREGDPQSIVAHLGQLVGYLILLLLLLKLASVEMTERVRAESQLAQLIDQQERRVRERTADLEAEVAVRREAEENAQSQLQRLNLLHQITRATSDRKDLHSIYDVVVRSLEEQLPVDL
jgi:hypothetical protein